MAQINPKQIGSNQTGFHSRSLSQPTFFNSHGLPPLSPYSIESSMACSNSSFKNVSMEEVDVSSLAALTSPRENLFRGNPGRPPRKGHRRSTSDVASVFSPVTPISSQETGRPVSNIFPAELKRREMVEINKPEGEVVDEFIDSFMNVDTLNACGGVGGDGSKDKDSISSGSKMSCGGGDGSNSDSETASRLRGNSQERVKRSATEDITPPLFRHSRSLSMDSGIGKFLFADSSPSSLEMGHGGFNEAELKKIVADERLTEIAASDPKRVKRILANRQSAARSKERKLRYISELEHKVQTLQTEATTLSAQITTLQNEHNDLLNLNSELKLRLQAGEQQARLRDALHETLLSEVERLKIADMEMRGERVRSSNFNARYAHVFSTQDQQRGNQMQQLSGTTSKSTSGVSERATSSKS